MNNVLGQIIRNDSRAECNLTMERRAPRYEAARGA
jgi:hypothetical protein